MVLEKLKVFIDVNFCSEKVAKVIFKAINPEDKLAPEKIFLLSSIKKSKIYYICEADFKKHPNLKISTLKRTIDDLIWSILTAYKVLKQLYRFYENEQV